MKKMIWGLVIIIAIIGGFFIGKQVSREKEIELKDNQILVKVKEVGDSRFTADILEGSELFPYQDEIVFTYENNDDIKQLQVDSEVILEIPDLPIMTNSIPPQMPQTKIVEIIK